MKHLTKDDIARYALDEKNPPPDAGYEWKPLTPEEKGYVDTHIKSCNTCREDVATCKQTLGFQMYVAATVSDPE